MSVGSIQCVCGHMVSGHKGTCVSVGSIQCVCGHMVSGHGVGLKP